MELYIQPTVTLFPTASILPGDAVRASMMWLDATPEQIAAAGYIPITEPNTTQPANTTMVVNKDQAGEYTAAWMPTAEYEELMAVRAAASVARARRNALLSQSDWTQGKDIPDSISTPWATYRQALRDITTQSGFPSTIVWPTPPQQE